jgi:hypothetical protein
MDVDKYYGEAYSKDEFLDIYRYRRQPVYYRMAAILEKLEVRFAIDVGCASGLFVETLNEKGVNCYGVDLDIASLRADHALLQSAGNFYYGDADCPVPIPAMASAVIYLDTLRYIEKPTPPATEFILVKDVCSGLWARYLRRNQQDLRHYSPQDLLKAFPGYHLELLYGPRERFEVRRPGLLMRMVLNQLPTYTAVLQRDVLAR